MKRYKILEKKETLQLAIYAKLASAIYSLFILKDNICWLFCMNEKIH